jgi:hypothetical protein
MRTTRLVLWGLMAGQVVLMAAQFTHNQTTNLLEDTGMTVIRRDGGIPSGFRTSPPTLAVPAPLRKCQDPARARLPERPVAARAACVDLMPPS